VQEQKVRAGGDPGERGKAGTYTVAIMVGWEEKGRTKRSRSVGKS